MNRTSSLADFLEQYRRHHPEDVILVDDEIDVEYESTAYYKLLEAKNPLIWFSKVKGYPDFPEGTNAKMIIVTKNSGLAYRKVVTIDFVKLVSGNSEVIISHKPTAEARVNIIVGDDIDLQSSNQIVWALSTRLRPDKDVAFGDDGRIVFDTTRMTEKLEVPSLPRDVIERIGNKLREA